MRGDNPCHAFDLAYSPDVVSHYGGLCGGGGAFPHAMLSVYTNEPALLVESVPSLYVIAGAMIIASVANIYFNAISGTGNTQAALILEMGTLVFYALYILWIGMVVKAPVSVCFSIEVVYYSLLLLSSIIYLKKQNGRIKRYKVHKFLYFAPCCYSEG